MLRLAVCPVSSALVCSRRLARSHILPAGLGIASHLLRPPRPGGSDHFCVSLSWLWYTAGWEPCLPFPPWLSRRSFHPLTLNVWCAFRCSYVTLWFTALLYALPRRAMEEQSGTETCLILEWGECLRRGTDMSKDLCSVGALLMKTTFQVFTANLMTEF